MKPFLYLFPVFAAPILATAYEVHEWGTFTTVSGSDGVLLSGLQREEEPLPPFVHSHLGLENGQPQHSIEMAKLYETYGKAWLADPLDMKSFVATKGMRRPVTGVTVKMETPVIYFLSKEGFRAKVNVGFEGGTISQWYPARSGGETLPMPPIPADPQKSPPSLESWRIDFSKGYQGSIAWDVDVLSPEESRKAVTFKPADTTNWMRARVPEANVVRVGRQHENYLFYRGIGNFQPGLETKFIGDETFRITNNTGGKIPYLLVFEKANGVIKWHTVDAGLDDSDSVEIGPDQLKSTLTSLSSISIEPTPRIPNPNVIDTFEPAVYDAMRTALVKTGLLDSEAQAMVQTWWNSYFDMEGLRVFWILPRSKTDAILPLKIEPAPSSVVRVIVGRSEVLRPSQEKDWLAESKKPANDSRWNNIVSYDRFGIAIRNRIDALNAQNRNDSTSKR